MTQSLTSLHIQYVQQLYMLIFIWYIVVIWWFHGTVGDRWKICLCLLVDWGKLYHFQRPHSQPQRIPNLKCEVHNSKTMYKRFHTLILALLHPSIHLFRHPQIHSDILWISSDFLHQAQHLHSLTHTAVHSFIHPPGHCVNYIPLQCHCFALSFQTVSNKKLVDRMTDYKKQKKE